MERCRMKANNEFAILWGTANHNFIIIYDLARYYYLLTALSQSHLSDI